MVTGVLMFIVIAALTMIVLCGWVVVTLIRGASHILTGNPSDSRSLPATRERQCPQRGCQAGNPGEARFCRRCGTPLVAVRTSSSSVRRAACW